MKFYKPLLNLGHSMGLPLPAYVSVMGGFRSGTNYLRYLLEKNYRVQVNYNAYGWKHAGLPIRKYTRRGTLLRPPVISIAKNPFAYLISLHRYYNERNVNILAETEWDAFLESPFVVLNRNDRRSTQYYFGNPVQYWNFINWNLTFTPKVTVRSVMVTYDAVLLNPQRELARAAQTLGLRARSGDFRTPQGYMRRLSDEAYKTEEMMVGSQTSPKATFITEKQYLDVFSPAQQRFVAGQADPRLCKALGLTGDEYSL